MKQSIRRLASWSAVAGLAAAPAAWASITLGAPGDRTACPDPTFGACYIGVDGSRVATVDAGSSSSFSFVALGVQSNELSGVTFPGTAPTGPTTPDGYLEVAPGATLTTGGTFNPARPYDTSVFVGLGNNSTGTLFVNGGQVNTPVLVIGETDARVSTGSVVLANGTSSIVATFDSSTSGPLPGFTAIQIARGLGSSGDLSLGTGTSVTATAGSVSIGRAGTGSLELGFGSTFSTAGSLYASAGDPNGVSSISIATGATLQLGVGSRLLLGIAADPTTTGLNQGYLTGSAPGANNHGQASLIVNGAVNGEVDVGAGGLVGGNGTIHGNLNNFGGEVSPGNSPGTLHVDGNFLMDGGTYLVQIAGTGPGMTDLLDVSGSASISNATILFSFIDGFAPSAGFSFDFLSALGSVTLSNTDFEVEGLAPGFTFDTSNLLAGGVGTLGFTATSTGVSAVPEPQTLSLLFIGLFLLVSLSRRAWRGVSVA